MEVNFNFESDHGVVCSAIVDPISQSSSVDIVWQPDIFANVDIRKAQLECDELRPFMDCLESAVLPNDDKQARKLLLQVEQFTLINGVLHHLFQPHTKEC